jgi:C4-type Zn-finger protein
MMIILSMVLFLNTGCKSDNIEGSLSDIMTKLYEGIDSDSLEDLENIVVDSENQDYYIGDVSFKYTEALASEPSMSSVAHSAVLIRVKDTLDIEKYKEEIKKKVDPEKWVCVSVDKDNVYVENKGNLILLVMDDENGSAIRDNFLNLE